MKTQDTTTLYWNEQGMICCAKHAPYRGSDTWNSERWEAVPAVDETKHLRCECCPRVAVFVNA